MASESQRRDHHHEPSDVGEIVGLGRWQIQIFLFFFAAAFFSCWENVSLPFVAFESSFRCADAGSQKVDKCHFNGSISCTSWQYDTSFFKSSIISEWDLVCSRSWMASFSQTMYMFGMLTAAIVSGHAADHYGRKPIIMIGFSMEILAGFYGAFAPSVQHYYAARFLMAFGQTARFITGFILVRLSSELHPHC